MKSVSILVTDKYSNLDPKISGSLVFIWDEFSKNKNYISIPSLVEERAEKYRSEFLEWIYFFSQTKINGTTLFNHLKFEDGFPFWWTTSLGQRFNIQNNSQINDVIKSMAFYDYLTENRIKPSLVEVNSEKKELVDFIKKFPGIKNLKIKYVEKKSHKKKRKSVVLYGLYVFRFVIYQIFQRKLRSLKGVDFVFFDVFTHLKNDKDFKSNYWTKLVDIVKKKSVLWNHIYYRSGIKCNYIYSIKKINLFNRHKPNHNHRLLEQNLSFKNYLKILNNFFKIKKRARSIVPWILKSFKCNMRGIDFSSWIKDDFFDSILGQEALKNCYFHLLIKKSVEITPNNARAIYIQEFQPWEIALVYYWKKTKANRIIGMPHSTHRYWDLRYFFGKSFFSSYNKEILPDQIAVNGMYSYDRCIESGYPKSILRPVEALRYIDHPLIPVRNRKIKSKYLNILICCDYQLKTSKKIFKIIDKILRKGKFKYILEVRMHPSFPLPSKVLKKYNLKLNNNDLIPALRNADWIITSNLSAIAVDAFYQGCNIAQLSDGKYFNLSPLRGVVNNLLFSNSNELKKMIEGKQELNEVKDYFFLDPELKLWKECLFNNKTRSKRNLIKK